MNRPKRKAAKDSEVNAKRAKGETDLEGDLKWHQYGDVIKGVCPLLKLTSDILPGCDKVAGFDIDFTVIRTASGRRFATGASDWEFWDEVVPSKLQELHHNGYRVIFFTNQAGIEKLKVKPEEFMKKTEAIIKEAGVPIYVFACTGTNHFRKPSTMMWEHFVKYCNKGIKPDKSKCFYVGDAAGRAKEWSPGKPKDFSCSDRMFAANVGIDFYTPEEYFLKEPAAPFQWRSMDPNTFLTKAEKPKKVQHHSNKQELVVICGCPASGKSTFRRRHFEKHGYQVVNRDTMGTMDKCVKAAKEAVKNGKSVVADNTNPSTAARKDFVEVAKRAGIPCRCFVMKTPLELAHHLNLVRQNQTEGQVRRIPDVGYHVYRKNFESPTKAEGFSEIIEIDFIPEFDNKSDESLFRQWTDSA
ncbi:bifunctional polynucleotide phosphatase/kinase-like [Mytilus californianus]|uniref:bifunctional polynucleotide phosphatase/kinase-like n=1 Tax=Mytilus californianus TaxID=6549 RepID=UPI0022463877|nr:bifunctional polynucleotide phosphatase/kinase-like [Mytilus californianus]